MFAFPHQNPYPLQAFCRLNKIVMSGIQINSMQTATLLSSKEVHWDIFCLFKYMASILFPKLTHLHFPRVSCIWLCMSASMHPGRIHRTLILEVKVNIKGQGPVISLHFFENKSLELCC